MLAGMFTVALSMGMVGLALPLYAKDLGASYTEIGLLGVAYVVFNVLLSVPAGQAADRWGRGPFLVLGFFATACVLVLYSSVGAVAWLIALRFVQGAAEAPIWVNAQGTVADLSARDERGRAMGAYGTSWAAGFAIGPLLSGAFYGALGAARTFLLGALVAFAATAIIAGMRFPRPRVAAKNLQPLGLWPAYVAGLVYVGIVSVVFTLFPAYVTKGLNGGLGMTEVEAGLLLTLFAGIRAALFVPMGGVSDRFGHRPVILAGMLVLTLTSASIALATGYLLLAAIISLMAAAEGAIYPAVMSMVSKAGEGQNLGYVLGIFNAVAMLGWGLFPGIGGVFADAYGPTSPYLICAAVALITSVLLWRLLPEK